MNCPLQTKEGAEILLDYCSQRMDPDYVAEFQSHVAVCSDCRQVVEAQEAVWKALDSYEALPVSNDFDRKLWARIEAEEQQSWLKRSWVRFVEGPAIGWSNFLFAWKPMAVAATACAAVAAVMIVATPRPVDPQPADANHQIIQHVESALDEIDVLNQIGVIDAPATGSM